jgi:hypothetical protein
MKLKNYKLILALLLLFIPTIVFAQVIGQSGLDVAASGAGFVTDPQKASVSTVIVRVINGFLSIFAMVFTYFIISAGFSWMTSGGNAEKVLAAKTTLKNAFLGLLLILISYSLTLYITNALMVSTGLRLTPGERLECEAYEMIVEAPDGSFNCQNR